MLEIRNKAVIKGFLRIEDLEEGELFTFLDSEDILLRTDYDYYFVNLETGAAINGEDDDYWNRPVRILNAELTIKN